MKTIQLKNSFTCYLFLIFGVIVTVLVSIVLGTVVKTLVVRDLVEYRLDSIGPLPANRIHTADGVTAAERVDAPIADLQLFMAEDFSRQVMRYLPGWEAMAAAFIWALLVVFIATVACWVICASRHTRVTPAALAAGLVAAGIVAAASSPLLVAGWLLASRSSGFGAVVPQHGRSYVTEAAIFDRATLHAGVPFLIAQGLFVAFAVFVWMWVWISEERARSGRCVRCDFPSATGLAICTECGNSMDGGTVLKQGSRRIVRWAPGVLFGLGIVAVSAECFAPALLYPVARGPWSSPIAHIRIQLGDTIEIVYPDKVTRLRIDSMSQESFSGDVRWRVDDFPWVGLPLTWNGVDGPFFQRYDTSGLLYKMPGLRPVWMVTEPIDGFYVVQVPGVTSLRRIPKSTR